MDVKMDFFMRCRRTYILNTTPVVGSESDDDEFSGNKLVYDSEEEEEGTNETLTADKKKVDRQIDRQMDR